MPIIVKGMKDFNVSKQKLYNKICDKVKNSVKKYIFEEISTPIIEKTEIFTKSSGELSDIVSKEMYYITTNEGINQKTGIETKSTSKESLSLRPEGTASFARFIYDQKLTETLPQKLFSHGPMFRHERPQSGRFRQFHQFSVEHFESKKDPLNDVELIMCAVDVLKELNIHAKLEFNTVGDHETKIQYKKALYDYFYTYKDDLSELNRKRLDQNPLRILDSKENIDIINGAPNIQLYLSDESRAFFEKFEQYLYNSGIESFLNKKLVRGLDYYQDIIFEFKVDDLAILAGGRYDGLVDKICGINKNISSLGWSLGIDRAMMLLEDTNFMEEKESIKFAFIPCEESDIQDAIATCAFLRSCAVSVSIFFEGKLSKSLEKSYKAGYTHALIYGENEKKGEYLVLKNLKTGKQVNLPMNKIKDMTSPNTTE